MWVHPIRTCQVLAHGGALSVTKDLDLLPTRHYHLSTSTTQQCSRNYLGRSIISEEIGSLETEKKLI